LKLSFTKLTTPTPEIAETFQRWENDVTLKYLTRPNENREELERQHTISVESLVNRIKHDQMYLIYIDDKLVGEMDFQIDPSHLFKKETGTAWIGIVIGEEEARGKGIGWKAMQFLEEQIQGQGLRRIELGVFEFNANAIRLYQKAGYQEISRIPEFTYWQGKMWDDIRMEKYL